ncbi:hypothetical protein Tco_1500123 [Tanacetum coccineum]
MSFELYLDELGAICMRFCKGQDSLPLRANDCVMTGFDKSLFTSTWEANRGFEILGLSDLNAVGCLTTDWFLSGCPTGFPKIDGFAT